METFKRTVTKTDIVETLEKQEKAVRIIFAVCSVIFSLTFGLAAYAAQQVKRQYISEIGFIYDILTVIFISLPVAFILYAIIDSILTSRDLKNNSFIVTEDRVLETYKDKYNRWYKIKGTRYESGIIFKNHGNFKTSNKVIDETRAGDVFYVVSYSFRKNKALLVYNKNKYNCVFEVFGEEQ